MKRISDLSRLMVYAATEEPKAAVSHLESALHVAKARLPKQEKPAGAKRVRRTKAQIEADKSKEQSID